jgi:hypothetical protein
MNRAAQPLSTLTATASLLTNPQAWIDPKRRHLLAIAPDLPAHLANRLIVHRAKLRPVAMPDLTYPHAPLLIDVWPSIPALAYLIGACCLRADIFACNAWSQLRYGADRFLSLPLPVKFNCPAISTADQFDLESEILAVGQQCIEQAVAPTPAWRDSIFLRLPPVSSARLTSLNLFSQSFCRQLLDCAISFHDTAT